MVHLVLVPAGAPHQGEHGSQFYGLATVEFLQDLLPRCVGGTEKKILNKKNKKYGTRTVPGTVYTF